MHADPHGGADRVGTGLRAQLPYQKRIQSVSLWVSLRSDVSADTFFVQLFVGGDVDEVEGVGSLSDVPGDRAAVCAVADDCRRRLVSHGPAVGCFVSVLPVSEAADGALQADVPPADPGWMRHGVFSIAAPARFVEGFSASVVHQADL